MEYNKLNQLLIDILVEATVSGGDPRIALCNIQAFAKNALMIIEKDTQQSIAAELTEIQRINEYEMWRGPRP